MKRNKETGTGSEKQASTRDLVIANRISGKMHGGLSRIRLSLTFRIALHYCLQLFRSFIPACLILSIVFSVAVSIPVSGKLSAICSTEETGVEPEIYTDYLTVRRTDTIRESGFFPRLKQQAVQVFQGDLLNRKLWFYYTSASGDEWLVCLDLKEIVNIWLLLLGGILLVDLFRMFYFFRHDQRLNRRVLSPIRDIASMAATLSENNLSNRINIAGTKNELKDLANVINSMLDRLERSYNSQKQFVSDASHELRTPISVIRGYTDMLKRWGKDDPEILDEGITAISQETEGMKNLVESLLFLARHDKQSLMMEISGFDSLELVTEVQKEESMVHEDHVFELDGMEPVAVSADRKMIKQVLRILCDNAVKYSPAGSTVTLSSRKNDLGECCLSVKDMGEGIPSEDLPKIFDRFYRSDKARKSETGGHGLGLSIARIIIVAHKGRIQVRSKPGAGTEFTVILPA